ncbi:MAG: hypothetical protein M0Z41_11685 [Peptococcaceae bacterium]|jgi:hypothetical protein|nr:hypothetical protein [Peptococcaceae bacterium]
MFSNQQIQQQIQAIRHDLQNISQVASQLQQAEHSNRVQLQNLQQNEALAFQQLQQLQQVIGHVNLGINQINSLAMQATQTGMQYGTGWGTYATGQPSTLWQGGIAGQFTQPGSYAGGMRTSPYAVSGTYNQGLTTGTQYGQAGWGGTQFGGANQFGTGQYVSGNWGNQYGGSQFEAGSPLGGMTGQGYGSFGTGMQPYRTQFEVGQLGSAGGAGLSASAVQGGSYTGQASMAQGGSYTGQASAGKMS